MLHTESLALFNTGISGEIPDLSNLQKLEVFKVENCALTGDGFMSLYKVPSLKVLGVAGSAITGSLEGVDKLPNLEELYLSQTSISGPLPQGMGNLYQLKYIKSSETYLTGAIPTSLGELKNLVEIDFSMNQFTGVLPTELGNLVNIEVLHLQDNLLEGKVPIELGNLISIKSMDLRNNMVSGEVPYGLCVDGAIIEVSCSVTCALDCCTNYEC